MTWLFIEPADVWLFRDGKPFDAGSDHRARSLFPPNPTTIQGVIRSKLLMASGVPLPAYARKDPTAQAVANQIGWPGDRPPFALRGPFVARCVRDPNSGNAQVTAYLPLPTDVVKVGQQYPILQPLRDNPFRANWPQDGLLPLWFCTNQPIKEAAGWLAWDALVACLKGTSPTPIQVLNDERLFVHESRFGVGIDSRMKRPEEGLLYQVEFARPRQEIGLLVEVNDSKLTTKIQLPGDGLTSIGGESRGGRYEAVAFSPPPNPLPTPDTDDKTRLKLYCATPAWFAGGWQAADWSNWLGGINLRLVSAAVRRAQSIGGARIDTISQQGNFQKAMYRYVPAGSVFFFEADGPISYTGDPVTDSPDDGQIGFGQVLAGQWDYA
jgi:CRISPR-associated protein Cmr3